MAVFSSAISHMAKQMEMESIFSITVPSILEILIITPQQHQEKIKGTIKMMI